MYAPPKQKGKVKEQLKYIGRPAIALGRIEEYDGLFLTFKYMDKTDGKEKREKITVEEFIGRLIRHIPDENFKTIRYYGDRDSTTPPMFSWEKCGGQMYAEHYKGVHGIEYKLSDVL